MNRLSSKSVVATLAFFFAAQAAAVPAQVDETSAVFGILSQTATQICGDVPSSGWNVEGSASVAVDAPLGSFFRKLIDAKVAGNAGLNGGKYAGPLREQLQGVRHDTQDCKRAVFDRLLEYLQDTQKSQNVPAEKRVQLNFLAPKKVVYPKEKAEQFATRFLKTLDAGNYAGAYRMEDDSLRALITEHAAIDAMSDQLSKCLPIVKRDLVPSEMTILPAKQAIAGRDEYVIAYRTIYKDGKEPSESGANERVGVVLSDDQGWQVIEYAGGCRDS
ncbi:hypothetical protein [Dyella sp. C9]|uniref:hypothetical protein n=1 Tax=Dyella sp. C9 TaxID=2202154 RepID=UPI00130076D1|nr:hypothetical protein [Dyella sp. C9]